MRRERERERGERERGERERTKTCVAIIKLFLREAIIKWQYAQVFLKLHPPVIMRDHYRKYYDGDQKHGTHS